MSEVGYIHRQCSMYKRFKSSVPAFADRLRGECLIQPALGTSGGNNPDVGRKHGTVERCVYIFQT